MFNDNLSSSCCLTQPPEFIGRIRQHPVCMSKSMCQHIVTFKSNEEKSANEVKSASQAELKDMARNRFQKVSVIITNDDKKKNVLLIKGLISKEDVFQKFNCNPKPQRGIPHLQTSMPSPEFEHGAYGTEVSVTKYYTGWVALKALANRKI
ncbi:hypothetical protein TNCV_3338301 [Trichonephila clavipes]|nr:hypothetical protein TNCV_3338301 [Trichonephila clavipes]